MKNRIFCVTLTVDIVVIFNKIKSFKLLGFQSISRLINFSFENKEIKEIGLNGSALASNSPRLSIYKWFKVQSFSHCFNYTFKPEKHWTNWSKISEMNRHLVLFLSIILFSLQNVSSNPNLETNGEKEESDPTNNFISDVSQTNK